MAGLEGLLPLIYHEIQQPGSLLCAQHALNSLLQGNYFTAPDLSELARHLDDLEQSYNEDIRGHASANMDDTGFFSVQVLENALHVWGLSLVRWRSEAMKPNHNSPHMQLAFVLNQNQHWYTLRRFGNSRENGHWFNLDSTKPSPQWISKTYLGMFLQQAEQEGYSIFVVVSFDISNDSPLPRCDADNAASTLPDPSSASSSEPGFENEDVELQAALQASLATSGRVSTASGSGRLNRADNYPSPVIPSSRTFLEFSPDPTPAQGSEIVNQLNIPPNQDPYGNADVDPVTASMERNRVIMERMRQEQEEALREQYEGEVAQFGRAQERYLRQRREAEDEDTLFPRGTEEALAQHRTRTSDDTQMADLDSDDENDYHTPPALPNAHAMDRVYDDDDAELQAALKASLETMPAGFTLPPNAPPPQPQRLTNESSAAESLTSTSQAIEGSKTETETETEADPEGASNEPAQQSAKEEVSLEEMRKRRLARFGG